MGRFVAYDNAGSDRGFYEIDVSDSSATFLGDLPASFRSGSPNPFFTALGHDGLIGVYAAGPGSSDSRNQRIWRVNTYNPGDTSSPYGNLGAAPDLIRPACIALNPVNRRLYLYGTRTGGRAPQGLYRINPADVSSTTAPYGKVGDLTLPRTTATVSPQSGMAFDSSGVLWLTNQTHLYTVGDLDGTPSLTEVGIIRGSTATHLSGGNAGYIEGLAFDPVENRLIGLARGRQLVVIDRLDPSNSVVMPTRVGAGFGNGGGFAFVDPTFPLRLKRYDVPRATFALGGLTALFPQRLPVTGYFEAGSTTFDLKVGIYDPSLIRTVRGALTTGTPSFTADVSRTTPEVLLGVRGTLTAGKPSFELGGVTSGVPEPDEPDVGWAVEIEGPQTIRLWSGEGDLPLNGRTYAGVGQLISISPARTHVGEVPRASIEVDASDPALKSYLLRDHGPVDVTITWIYSSNGGLDWVPLPYRTIGVLSEPTMTADRYGASVEPRAFDFDRTTPLQWNDEAQRDRFPGDTGFHLLGRTSRGESTEWPQIVTSSQER